MQRYTHLSQRSVRTAYDSVFSGEKPTEPKICVQKHSTQPENAKSERYDLKEKLLEGVLEGKIAVDRVGEVVKLLSLLDGRQEREKGAQIGYI